MSHQVGIIDALKDWGLTVVTVQGWQSRGSSDFNPRGHVVHHDVVPPVTEMPNLIKDGRPDLPGPLANFWLERNGRVWLLAAGRANHAGSGGWNGLSGNSSVWGTEMNNRGVPSDPWPVVQLDAMARLAAATCEFSGFPVGNVCGHKEWTDRKIDPHTIDMDAFRTQIRLQEKDGLTVADIEALRQTIIKQHQLDRVVMRRQGAQTRVAIARSAKDTELERASKNEVEAADDELAKLSEDD